MANPNLMHEGNEGCFKIHRNKENFELKFAKNKSLYILAKSEDYSVLDKLRFALYRHYGSEATSPHRMESIEVRRVAERLMSKMTKGELESVMDERVDRHKEESPIASKIVIKKEKERCPVSGDFIVVISGSDRDLGIIADINGEDHFVFIDSGASLPLEEVLCLGWCFATTTVEAVWA